MRRRPTPALRRILTPAIRRADWWCVRAVVILDRMIDVAATRVFLVEDQPPMRERLHEYLAEIEGVMVVGDAATPRDAIAGILETLPDLVLLDYHLDGGTGIEVLRGVGPVAPGVVFVVLTQHDGPQLRRACLAAGASYVLDKATEFGQIRQLVAAVGTVRN